MSSHAHAAAMRPVRQWSRRTWLSPLHTAPTQDSGRFDAELGKVFVWVLSEEDVREGNTPSLCGYHLERGVFEEHDQYGDYRVVYWSPYEEWEWADGDQS